ncbi:hypothetical protein HS088_TW15G00361 [Tripterygium wilfordii]|uniref:DUF7054 domain-containing protein n=1 Tax=Tripterygium wilfordii TaxID=458696 RepID=A0A7J7CLN7_TRIWF|nr:hypothetical protein HS088_TW15G00361 [Tripterygium wilfordii]
MSGRNLRRRLRVNVSHGRNTRPPKPSPSSRRRTSPPMPKSAKYAKPQRIMKRCYSDSMLLSCNGEGVSDDQEGSRLGSDRGDFGGSVGVLYRPQTCTDVFASTSSLPGISTEGIQGYKKDAKVVVNVTVEGSPGPVRTMVKLGCCVEETIKLVLKKYSEEQRSPKVDKNSPSSYELHQSNFTLQCLDKSKLIGETGSRSFYLRRISSNLNTNKASSSLTSDIAPAGTSSPPAVQPTIILFSAFIARKFCKLIRRTGKLLKLLICIR